MAGRSVLSIPVAREVRPGRVGPMDLTGFLINNYLLTYRISEPGELEVY